MSCTLRDAFPDDAMSNVLPRVAGIGLVAGRSHGKNPASRIPRSECSSRRALDQAGPMAAALA